MLRDEELLVITNQADEVWRHLEQFAGWCQNRCEISVVAASTRVVFGKRRESVVFVRVPDHLIHFDQAIAN